MKKLNFILPVLAFLILSACSNESPNSSDNSYSVERIRELAAPIEEPLEKFEFIDRLPEDVDDGQATLGLPSWYPNGEQGRGTPPQCRLSSLRATLGSVKDDIHGYYEKFKSFFDACHSYLNQGAKIGLLTDLKLIRLNYKISDNPLVHNVVIEFKNGEKLRGLLALKEDTKKRPFVIARCGVFCNTSDHFMRYMLMHVFDEAPFNVLVLPSTTGTEYVAENSTFGIGGYLEAAQHIKIAEFLRSPSSGLSDRITHIHVMGGSLGGSSALMTSVLSQYNYPSGEQPPITSVFALCPVVDLRETLEEVFHKKLIGGLMTSSAWESLQLYYYKKDPAYIDKKKPPVDEILKIIDFEAQQKYSQYFKGPDFLFKPFESLTFGTQDEVWFSNRFTPQALNISTPTFVWTGYDDPIVPTRSNAEKLMKLTQNSLQTAVKTYITPGGRHCAESLIYGWGTASESIRSFILSFESEFKSAAQPAHSTFDPKSVSTEDFELKSNEFHFSQSWSIKKNSSNFEVNFEIWSPVSRYNCAGTGPYEAFVGCFRNTKLKLPLSAFASETQIQIPKTDAQAQALTRWANTNLEIYGSDNKELHHSKASPLNIRWTHY